MVARQVRANEALFHMRGMSEEEVAAIPWPSEAWARLGVSRRLIDLRRRFPSDAWTHSESQLLLLPYAGTVSAAPTERLRIVRARAHSTHAHTLSHTHTHSLALLLSVPLSHTHTIAHSLTWGPRLESELL